MASEYIGTTDPSAETKAPPLDLWEYKVLEDKRPLEDKLNLLGQQGWEMIVVYPQGGGKAPTFYFKRRLRTANLLSPPTP